VKHTLLATTLLALTATAARSATNDRPRAPVLIELFTSEGCSSCPPVDALLEKLDRMQQVPGAQVIVLSEHVDYWNRLGWNDPFSSPQFSTRQNAYAQRLRLDSVYTPQLIIDGGEQFVGSDEPLIRAGISRSAIHRKASVQIASAVRDGPEAVIHVISSGIPTDAPFTKADIWIALADNQGVSQVGRGENSGRMLRHVAVARSLTKIGTTTVKEGLDKIVRLPVNRRWNSDGLRVIAFVQQTGQGGIAGADLVRLVNRP
jgi:hypothetical protein